MLSLQEIFDRGLAHIRQQGEPSLRGASLECMYLNPQGLSCAVGCLIKPELLAKLNFDQPDNGSTSISRLLSQEDSGMENALLESGISVDEDVVRLLAGMQQCHDSASSDCDFMPSFESNMENLADHVALTYKAQP